MKKMKVILEKFYATILKSDFEIKSYLEASEKIKYINHKSQNHNI